MNQANPRGECTDCHNTRPLTIYRGRWVCRACEQKLRKRAAEVAKAARLMREWTEGTRDWHDHG